MIPNEPTGTQQDRSSSDAPASSPAAPAQSDPVDSSSAPIPSDIADGVERRLDPRSIPHQRTVGAIFTVCIMPWVLVGAVVTAMLPMLPVAVRWAAPLLLLFLCAAWVWAVYSYPALYHRHASYRVDRRGIEIRTGVWWRRILCVPRSRIQHTDVSQGPLERRFGLATLSVFTAGTEYSRVSLHGLAHGDALRIRDHLIAGGEGDGV